MSRNELGSAPITYLKKVLLRFRNRIGVFLLVTLGVGSTLSGGLPSTVAAQESQPSTGAKLCSRAVFERMMEQKAWGKCQGSFLAGTSDQIKEARILQDF